MNLQTFKRLYCVLKTNEQLITARSCTVEDVNKFTILDHLRYAFDAQKNIRSVESTIVGMDKQLCMFISTIVVCRQKGVEPIFMHFMHSSKALDTELTVSNSVTALESWTDCKDIYYALLPAKWVASETEGEWCAEYMLRGDQSEKAMLHNMTSKRSKLVQDPNDSMYLNIEIQADGEITTIAPIYSSRDYYELFVYLASCMVPTRHMPRDIYNSLATCMKHNSTISASIRTKLLSIWMETGGRPMIYVSDTDANDIIVVVCPCYWAVFNKQGIPHIQTVLNAKQYNKSALFSERNSLEAITVDFLYSCLHDDIKAYTEPI